MTPASLGPYANDITRVVTLLRVEWFWSERILSLSPLPPSTPSKPWDLPMLGKHLSTELHPSPISFFNLSVGQKTI
jgi:hypothetical protein